MTKLILVRAALMVSVVVCVAAATTAHEYTIVGQGLVSDNRPGELATLSFGARHAPVPRQRSVDFIDEFAIDDTKTLQMTYEVLHDPEDSALFNRVGRLTVDPVSGRIFVVDNGDDILRVLSESGEHLFDLGRSSGQGPGDLDNPLWPLITESRELAVLQGYPPRISYFDPEDGAFLRMARVDLPTFPNLYGFFPLESGHLVVGTVSMTPSLYGKAIHLIDPRSGDGLSVVRSFAETQQFTAEFYEMLAGGRAAKDQDGAILYTQRSPYSIRKYDADGNEIWRLDDPDTVPIATSFLTILPSGRMRFDPYPFAISLLPIGPDQYVHSIFLIRDGWQEDGGSRFRTRLEFIRVEEDVVVERFPIDSTRRAYFTMADQKGRLYGFVNDGVFVRAMVEIDAGSGPKNIR